MIAKLKGIVIDTFPGTIILDVAGVGYRVEGYFDKILVENEVSLYIYTHVREQEIRLFGFLDRDEFILFEQLLQVSGVGPKAALTVIGNIGKEKIYQALDQEDPSLLRTQGVGHKTAARIVIDLKSKIEKLGLTFDRKNVGNGHVHSMEEEVRDALIGLGYRNSQIIDVLKEIEYDEEANSSDIIKLALKYLSKKSR